jgi:hypothetical protein
MIILYCVGLTTDVANACPLRQATAAQTGLDVSVSRSIVFNGQGLSQNRLEASVDFGQIRASNLFSPIGTPAISRSPVLRPHGHNATSC